MAGRAVRIGQADERLPLDYPPGAPSLDEPEYLSWGRGEQVVPKGVLIKGLDKVAVLDGGELDDVPVLLPWQEHAGLATAVELTALLDQLPEKLVVGDDVLGVLFEEFV